MATPNLQQFFAQLLSKRPDGQSRPLGRSGGLGVGIEGNSVQPTAAGEGIRALWGTLQSPEGANPTQVRRTAQLNMNAPGTLLSSLFNRDTFPALTSKPSPFPQPVTTPVPQRQFRTDPKPTPLDYTRPRGSKQGEEEKQGEVFEREESYKKRLEDEAAMYPGKPTWMSVERWLYGPDR
jgi:hypothetical protein